MKSWVDLIWSVLLGYYCVFGVHLINKYLFSNALFGPRLGLLMTVVFISAYPIFGWGRDSLWLRLGRWTLAKWSLFGVGAGILTILASIFSRSVVHYFSTQ